jgi:undecaprenyl phosphate-alpha-L-ara4FN deformylase
LKIGLRIDVDTFRGTKHGVPALCDLLKKHNIRATFYFSVGPDNMGRHLWRLLKPAFLWKMLRTDAAGLYGPEIILMGTMWPGPMIGKHNSDVIKRTSCEGHEIGLHAWDHYTDQAKTDRLSENYISSSIQKGIDELERITGKYPVTSAVPGWRCNNTILRKKAEFPFEFNSDCRGYAVFQPVIKDNSPGPQNKLQPQIPVTLPTYDEILGTNSITDENYNDYMIEQLKPEKLNILTIHAEAEGGKCLRIFDSFLHRTKDKGYSFTTLGEILKEHPSPPPEGEIIKKKFPGREGWLAVQKPV